MHQAQEYFSQYDLAWKFRDLEETPSPLGYPVNESTQSSLRHRWNNSASQSAALEEILSHGIIYI